MDHKTVIVELQLKEAILEARKAQFEMKNAIVNLVHVFDNEHDTENFRGCTHSDCHDLRKWFAEIGL